MNINSCKTCMA